MIIWRKQFTFSWGKWQNLLQIFPVYAVYCNNAMTKIVGFFSQNFSFFSKIWENVLEMIIYFLNLLIINWFEIFLRFRLCTQLLYSPYAALCINSLHINNNEIIVCKYSNIDNILPIHSWKLADNNPNCTGKNCENFFSFFPEFVIRAFFLKPPYLKKRANFYDNLREKRKFFEKEIMIFSRYFSQCGKK